MPNFSITTNADEFRRAIEDRRTGVQESVKKEIKQVAKDVRTTLYGMVNENTEKQGSFTAVKTVGGKATRPITVTHGRLKASFTQSPRGAGDAIFDVQDYSAKIGTNVPYMKFLEEGTRGHGPVRAKFLRFALPAGVVFAKFVRGIHPLRIFRRTEMMYKRIFGGRIRQAVARGLHR